MEPHPTLAVVAGGEQDAVVAGWGGWCVKSRTPKAPQYQFSTLMAIGAQQLFGCEVPDAESGAGGRADLSLTSVNDDTCWLFC